MEVLQRKEIFGTLVLVVGEIGPWNDVALRSGLHVARTQRLYMAKWYQNRGKRSENHGINDALLS